MYKAGISETTRTDVGGPGPNWMCIKTMRYSKNLLLYIHCPKLPLEKHLISALSSFHIWCRVDAAAECMWHRSQGRFWEPEAALSGSLFDLVTSLSISNRQTSFQFTGNRLVFLMASPLTWGVDSRNLRIYIYILLTYNLKHLCKKEISHLPVIKTANCDISNLLLCVCVIWYNIYMQSYNKIYLP